MAEEKQEKLPLDAKLLSDAVIELNISRRSVGLYPPEHPLVKTSIERAFQHLQKLHEIRFGITLGIAGDTLVVDEYTLDRKNPVFREFAQALHTKGVAAVTFSTGLSQAELMRLHELISSQDTPVGKELIELAAKDISHISLSPIDFSKFSFVEGAQRSGAESGEIWEEYVYGLLEGRLSDAAGPGIFSIPEEKIAETLNNVMTEDSSPETYDRVITAYIRKQGEAGMSGEALNKFLSLVNHLRPEIKRQFLARTGARFSGNIGDIEAAIADMTPDVFRKMTELFVEGGSLIPESLRNLIEKLSAVKQGDTSYFNFFSGNSAVLDDIELGDEVCKLLGGGHSRSFLSEEYQEELERMIEVRPADSSKFGLFREECEAGAIDGVTLDIMLELLHADFLASADYLELITTISEFMNAFIETGRFEQILEAYNTISSHMLEGRFKNEAAGIVQYFFHSPEFIAKIVDAFRLWGRKDREGAIRLARALRKSIIDPLLDALSDEQDASLRKFLLSVLVAIGSDVIPYAVKRLRDERWFVVRNMISIIRDCNGKTELDKIRKYLKHDNINICIEVLKTLLHFRTLDSIPQLRAFLQSEDPHIRQGAIRLAGIYRVRETVPYLIKHLDKRDLFGTEAYYKTDIVNALGEIGDSRAVETLRKIFNAKTLLYKGDLDALKVAIFRSLGNYPYESVRALVEQGLSSRNEEIHSLSEKYLVASQDGDIKAKDG